MNKGVNPVNTQKIKHDGQIAVATGRSRKETSWKNKTLLWSDLVEKLSNTTRTPETAAEYRKSPKTTRDKIKDVGGFVGGNLKGGRRKAENLANRTLITLDMDEISVTSNDIWDSIVMVNDFACVMYSTHSHTPESPRLRLVIPLSRPVLGDEYQAIGRMIASDLGIDQFDDTTYQPHRLMYWPSTACDAEYVFQFQDGAWLDPEEILGRYLDWKDISYWPESSRQTIHITSQIKRQEDPLEKKGLIGAFCKTYSITQAIAEFIPDVYTATVDESRYSFAEGSTVGGVIVYDDKFTYSHHGTDPTSGLLCNAFDLVRIHKFGGRDHEVKPDTPINRLPSFLAMSEFVAGNEKVKVLIGKERLEQAREDFDLEDDVEIDTAWIEKLKYDTKGKIISSIENVLTIIENDQNLKGKFAFNDFANRAVITGKLPWESDPGDWADSDDAGLRYYIESVYDITSISKIDDALTIAFQNNSFHPVRDYLSSLEWDKVKRLDTLLIDYLGAEDSIYARAISRKHLTAAVARVMRPGIKYDTMLTLTGAQGIGKSTFVRLLGQDWYSDSLVTVTGKEAFEQLQGNWLIEMGELTATRKADIEATKQFLSKGEDVYRVAYGRRTSRFPRQCIFFGTSNDKEFLRDRTGNRRFWPVDCWVEKPTKDVFKDLAEEKDQIWAEAVELYISGEKLYLEGAEETEARKHQEDHSEENSKTGVILEYLDKPISENWYELDIFERREALEGAGFTDTIIRDLPREKTCVMEIWCECFKGDPKALTPILSREINDILRGLDGWERSKSNLVFGKDFGKQRAYLRVD